MKTIKIGEVFEITLGATKGQKVMVKAVEVRQDPIINKFETFITINNLDVDTDMTLKDFILYFSDYRIYD